MANQHIFNPDDFRNLNFDHIEVEPTDKQNFWGNDICSSSKDCSGLTECSPHFGCVRSFWKNSLVMISGCVLLCCRSTRFRNAIMRRIRGTEIVAHSVPSVSSVERNITSINPQVPQTPLIQQFYQNHRHHMLYVKQQIHSYNTKSISHDLCERDEFNGFF